MKKFLEMMACVVGLYSVPLQAAEDPPLKVVATFSILGDLVQHVGGDRVSVITLVGPDADAHTFRPTPRHGVELNRAGLVVENGLGLDAWMDRLITASGYHGAVVMATNGVTARTMEAEEGGHGGPVTDPHAWQDVGNTRQYVRNVAAGLAQARPNDAAYFQARAQALDADLAQLDQWVRTELSAIPPGQRKIITSHDAFGYFGAAYGVTFLAPQGISTEQEPTAAQVAKLATQMKAEKVKLVFFETMASPRLITQLARDAGAGVGKPVYSDALSKADGPAPTYERMIRNNVTLFKVAMQQNGME